MMMMIQMMMMQNKMTSKPIVSRLKTNRRVEVEDDGAVARAECNLHGVSRYVHWYKGVH
jgi:hypothetical protein